MKTEQDIYNEIYGNSMKGIKQKIPSGWGLIKIQGQEPIIHSPSGLKPQPAVNDEYELEKQQMSIWDSFKDDPKGAQIDAVYDKMPQSVRNDYESRLLDLMESNKPVSQLDKEFNITDDGLGEDPILINGQWVDAKTGKPSFQNETERKLYETERKKYMQELRKSIELGR